ncbi:G5 domain-containing protein [Neobacillus citreus]|uniref:G5 domain-containing protein n=1 Tax=Neobacillus citreus TaxID=2833578 RepID=A0A942T471_9BACI|nr:G5 domain-containing protein [Neobacillus citreus]MCH6266688.1 G5 domain-containing protein [Neobacillus citreus]
MGKNKQMFKLFVVLFFSTAFIFSFSHFGAKAFESMSNADGKYSEGTTVGSMDVSGKTPDEALSLLEEQYVNWVKDTSMEMQYGEKTASFDLNLFALDTNTTVASIKEGQSNPIYLSIDKEQVEEQLQTLFPQMKLADYDLGKLTQSLNEKAANFQTGTHSFNLYNDFLLADHIDKDAVINVATVKTTNLSNLQTIIDKNIKMEIPENGTVSLLEFAKKNHIDNIETLNVLATGIYKAVLASNFTIIERNISIHLPNYAELGYEAKVDPAKMVDLAISNPNKSNYSINFQIDNGLLKVTLKGQKFLYDYKITTKDEQKLKPKTIVQYSPALSPGKKKIQTAGEEGLIIKVYREVYQGEQLVKSENISEDYYPPVYQVEVQGITAANEQQTSTATTNQTSIDNSSSSTNTSNQAQSTATGEQQESDIWGKPNEQPK